MTDEKSLENVEPLSTLRVRNTSPTETISTLRVRNTSPTETIEQTEDTEKREEEETPLKKPKKKFIMTPARMETLRKGREKRMQNISKKKEIEHKLKAEEKQKKEEIKQRVEEEFKKETAEPIAGNPAVVSKTIEEEIPKPKLNRVPRKPRKVKTPEPLLTLVDSQTKSGVLRNEVANDKGGRTVIFC